MPVDNDSVYLKKLSKGDHASFDALFLSYQPKVKAFFKGFMKNEDEASDMAQDLFIKVWINRKTMSEVNSFKSYLYRMARNMIYDYFEHSTVVENYERSIANKNMYQELIEEELYVKELELLIDIAIEQMPEQRKRIFRMSRMKGLTNEEIARQLQLNKRTVENHITQALSDLRKAIKNLYLLLF